MKFIAQIKPLQETLSKVIAVIPAKSTLPQLETVAVELKGNQLSFTGTDLEITVVASIEVTGVKDGTANIPAKLLNEIVRALPEGELTFTLDKTTKRAQLETAQGNYQLSVDETAQLPNALAEFKAEGSMTVDAATIRRLISKTLFAVSTDELRPSMMGVLFQFSPDGTRAVATDGHRLVRFFNPALKTESELDIIIPAKALNLVAKSFDDNGELSLSFSPSHVQFQSGDTTVLSRLIDERYPNYEAVIPRENDKLLVISKDAMLRSVKRVSIFANANTRQLRFQLGKDKMEILAENFDAGNEAHEHIPCDYANDALTIGFNGRFIEDALAHLDTDEISLKFSTPTRAAIVEPSEQNGEDLLMLVMPVRLNG
ncbi:MAG: DNA polymerase III subunit beta [Bacteroidota bacterium]|nr:DNA polymerase III subunit beta [Bacteroidota bacterium]MDP4234309.1 DNA polymerase III subunit beta [Bacteroidota bacterium]MDP4243243.1 DNA polymerase III subunit beta [Bacteroidota bacterium]MDP4288050.1 DNA polymerase III subunit beta [Bacteroidota bacterium]